MSTDSALVDAVAKAIYDEYVRCVSSPERNESWDRLAEGFQGMFRRMARAALVAAGSPHETASNA